VQTVQLGIEQALLASGPQAEPRLAGKDSDKLIITYPATKKGTGYAAATIQLKFGARATGELVGLRRARRGAWGNLGWPQVEFALAIGVLAAVLPDPPSDKKRGN
jgi:hypothetical protein